MAALNVRDNIRNALQKKFDILKRYDDVSNKFSDPNADYNALIEEQSCLQQIIDASDLWNLERRIDIAINALRCPPPETKVTGLSGVYHHHPIASFPSIINSDGFRVSDVVWPCAACCCKRRTCCCWMNLRTTWTHLPSPGLNNTSPLIR